MTTTIIETSRLKRGGLNRSLVGAAAVGSTGVSLMTANAEIIYSGSQNLSTDAMLGGDPTNADREAVNIDASGDLEFELVSFAGKGPATHVISGGGVVHNGMTNPNHGEFYVRQLPAGATVGPGDPFVGGFNQITDEVSQSEWPGGSNGFFGFTFNPTGNQEWYGWGRLTLSPDSMNLTLVDWAYDNAGAPIQTGAVPEPTASILLTTGLLVAAFWRRRRRCAT